MGCPSPHLSLTRRMSWWKRSTCSKLALSVTEKTMRKPSPVRMYCSRMALNSSCPAVSRTAVGGGHSGAGTIHLGAPGACRPPGYSCAPSGWLHGAVSTRPGLCCQEPAGPQAPQCEALTDLSAPWALILCLKKKPHEVSDHFCGRTPQESPDLGLEPSAAFTS